MIAFRCLGCSLKDLPIEISRCPRCGKIYFVTECISLSHPVTQLPPTARSITFSQKSAKAKRQVIGSSPAVQERNKSTWKDVTFFYEDSSFGIKRTDAESRGTKEAIGISLSGSNIHLKQEQPFQNFRQDPIQKKQFLPENQNLGEDTHSLPVSDSYNLNFFPYLMKAPFAEPHEPSSAECKSQSSPEMMTKQQKTADISLIQNVDNKMSFAGSSRFEPHIVRLQSYSESVISKSNLKGNRGQGNNSSPDFLTKTGNSSNRSDLSEGLRRVNEVAQQEAHSSDPRTRMETPEKASAWLEKSSSTPISQNIFVCGKCSKYFKSESTLDVHVNSNCDANPYKCDQCPEKFYCKSILMRHRRVHLTEKLFKCDLCDYASNWEFDFKTHEEKWHEK